MKLLVDQNIDSELVPVLRASGQDVVWTKEHDPRMIDELIVEWAVREHRIILTADLGFGKLVRESPYFQQIGLIQLRLHDLSRPLRISLALSAVAGAEDLYGMMLVVDPAGVRIHNLRIR